MIWASIWESRGQLLTGLVGTLVLAALALVTSTILGTVVGILRARRIPIVGAFLRLYLEVFRGSPLLVQLLFIYFGAAYLGFDQVTTLVAAVIGLTLYEGAYISEIVRAGIESVPSGQAEAAQSLGLSTLQTLRYVTLPQSLRVAFPPLIGQWIALVKDTALATVIGYSDLIQQGQAIYSRIAHPLETLLVVGVLYFIICYPLSLAARWLERRRIRA